MIVVVGKERLWKAGRLRCDFVFRFLGAFYGRCVYSGPAMHTMVSRCLSTDLCVIAPALLILCSTPPIRLHALVSSLRSIQPYIHPITQLLPPIKTHLPLPFFERFEPRSCICPPSSHTQASSLPATCPSIAFQCRTFFYTPFPREIR